LLLVSNGILNKPRSTHNACSRFSQIISKPLAGRNAKVEGLVAEGAEMIEEEADEEVKDAGLIAAAQRVEHNEMAGYGTARTYAELLGLHLLIIKV
jgi:ferritin-like metal-binding protein YciE